jgi:hypothetical protein
MPGAVALPDATSVGLATTTAAVPDTPGAVAAPEPTTAGPAIVTAPVPVIGLGPETTYSCAPMPQAIG